jgi:hypothetical protein
MSARPVLRLEAIAFNHDTTACTHDALNVRRSQVLPVLAPEWQAGVSRRPVDSVAAYAIAETRGNPLTIRANVRRLDPSVQSVEIRAVDLTGGVLGSVKPLAWEFGAGDESGFLHYELQGPRLADSGVGVHAVRWWWQHRLAPDAAWTTFARSDHQVYTVLSAPNLPWTQDDYPLNTQLVWTEVLDFACRFAQGVTTPHRAAARITEAIFALGPERLEYNCPNIGAPSYVLPDSPFVAGIFFCTAFLDYLKGGPGAGRYVNCSDCATIVSTFANALGCDLSQSRMGPGLGFFATNPILVIGSPAWTDPCGQPGFGMHEVAWTGACGPDDDVYDACLAVDADQQPDRRPHYPLLPTGMRFGRPGERLYRARLAAPGAQDECRPMPDARQRRWVV